MMRKTIADRTIKYYNYILRIIVFDISNNILLNSDIRQKLLTMSSD